MKKVLLLLSFLVAFFVSNAQYPVIQWIGRDSALVDSRGGFKARLINYPFTDTTEANTQRISQYPGAMIYTTSGGDKLWLRSSDATLWTRVGTTSGGGSGIVSLGTSAYGLITQNDSTYKVDTTLLSTKLWRQKGIDSVQSNVNLKLNITDTANMRVRLYEGSNITITGTYPNLTVASTGGGADTSVLLVDTLYNRLATVINVDSMRLKSLRIQRNGTNITPTSTDSTLSYNVLAVDSTQLIVIDTTGATTGQIAYIDRTGGDTIKFKNDSVGTGGSSSSGAFSKLEWFPTDEFAPEAGDSLLVHDSFPGKFLDVYRDGIKQPHVVGDTGWVRVNDSTIKVIPYFSASDKFWHIEARDSTAYTQLTLQAPAPSANLLLDDYTSAAGAYSLRLLRTAYSGHAIKVRRSSDNTTQDIDYLPSGYLDTASMKSFVTTNTGYVDTWYDQSGNGYNLTQATTGNQPIIIESGGTVYRQEGKVSVKFTSASSHYLTNTSLAAASAADAYIAYVLKNNTVSGNNIGFGMGSNAFVYQAGAATNKMYAYAGNLYGDYTNSSTSMQLSETIYDGGGATSADRLKYYSDGTAITANSFSGTIPATVSGTGLSLGKLYSVGVYFDGAASEFVIWLNDKSASRTGIESNINTFYSLY